MHGRTWLDSEIAYISKAYPVTPNREIAEVLGRSAGSIYIFANRLGLMKERYADTGVERVWADGYTFRKLPGRGWVPLHILAWEQTCGPVPAGHIVTFRDGNRANVEIENLECISRAEQLARYTVVNLPEALKQVIWLKGALTRKINALHN